MGGTRRIAAAGLAVGCALTIGGAAGALVLPPPPSLPPTTAPAALKPVLAVAGPTAGAACGTASLVVLLAPSLADGYFHIPLSSLIDRHTLSGYASDALYVCGFIPFPLTPTQCATDLQVVDALRGLNPLAAQVVGLYPEGATVDTILAIEGLLPGGASVAQPVADDLSRLMACRRSAGPPAAGTPTASTHPTPTATRVTAPPVSPVATAAPSPGPGLRPTATAPALPAVSAAPAAPPTQIALPRAYETRLIARKGLQWAALVVGLALVALSAGGWAWARRADAPKDPA